MRSHGFGHIGTKGDVIVEVKPGEEVWNRLIKIGEELGKGWQSEKSRWKFFPRCGDKLIGQD